ncbi:MAG: DUF5320 domain-containing protein [Candidatus Bipolaricaulota bacterium]|nr:MAG: DUF5320 domain-containing protein [Candidatus Bipolaricaulota bacterium]
MKVVTRKIHGCCEGGTLHDSLHDACCGFQRHFTTKAERRETLEVYRDQVQQELAGVEERLSELA